MGVNRFFRHSIALMMLAFCDARSLDLQAATLSDLIVPADGRSVFFRLKTGLNTDSWFRATPAAAGVSVARAAPNLADVDSSGGVTATAFVGERSCGFAGSSCFLQPPCRAQAQINAAAGSSSAAWTSTVSTHRETFIRLDPSGQLAWIEQGRQCGAGPLGTLHGLYEARTMELASPTTATGYRIANRRAGRRMITERKQVLVRDTYDRLAWWALDGTVRQIGNRVPPVEAVTDAAGCTVVYSSTSANVILWVDWCGSAGPREEVLGFAGSSLALSANGRYLAFQEQSTGLFTVYDRARRVMSSNLFDEPVESFAMGGTALFAVTARNGLQRLDLDSGEVVTVLPPLPEIDEVKATKAPVQALCPMVCYGPLEPRMQVSAGMLALVEGRNLDQPGWRVRQGEKTSPLMPLASSTAWFAYEAAETVLFHPQYPGLEMQLRFLRDDAAFACLAMDHEEGYRWVTREDPAVAGETIHVWLTGLASRNPPALSDPPAAEATGFSRSTDWTGLQRLDLRILRPFAEGSLGLFASGAGYGCPAPPVRMP